MLVATKSKDLSCPLVNVVVEGCDNFIQDPDDQLVLTEEAVQTFLESDLVTEHDGDPAMGIRNGVIGGSLIWTFISAIIFLLT